MHLPRTRTARRTSAGLVAGADPVGKIRGLGGERLVGIDIRAASGSATLGSKGGYALYRVGPLSGVAERVGGFRLQVVDLAVVHD